MYHIYLFSYKIRLNKYPFIDTVQYVYFLNYENLIINTNKLILYLPKICAICKIYMFTTLFFYLIISCFIHLFIVFKIQADNGLLKKELIVEALRLGSFQT